MTARGTACLTAQLALVLALAAAAAPALAQSWPTRQIKLLVPFAAGGNIDAMGRFAAQRLSDALGQQLVVENRVGANGTIATDAVKRAPADGYTLLWASTSTMAIFPAITKVNYDPIKDFAPISLFQIAPQMLVVTNKLPAQNVKEFIAHVKAQPERLSYAGGGGPGSASNLMMALFLKRAGLEMNNVSYRGTAPALVDIIAGHVPTMMVPIGEALPQARSGLVRMIAVTSARRAREAPEVPSLAEQGIEGYDMVSWTGLVAAAGTPREIIERMSGILSAALKDPEMIELLHKNGVDPAPDGSPGHFASFLDKEIRVWADAVRLAGVTLH